MNVLLCCFSLCQSDPSFSVCGSVRSENCSVIMSDEEREEKELGLTNSEVVTKYKSAAEIVNSQFPSPLPLLPLFIIIFLCYLFIIFFGAGGMDTNLLCSVACN